MNRIRNTLHNSIISAASYLILAVLALSLRKFFLIYLPTEFLGYEGLFGDIFSIMGVAELGINGVILYRMYPAIAKNDESAIAKIMAIYKLLYRIVGTIIAVIGIALIPFLKIIIKDNTLNWSYVYVVYGLQLIVSLCGYFLAYKRVLLVAMMREAVAVKIETLCSFISNLVKISVILITHNYILYIVVGVLHNVIMNAWVAHKVNKEYPYIKISEKITKKDIEELGIKQDLKNNVVQKLCTAIYGGTDSILISFLLGIKYVGLLSNYSLISGYVNNFILKLLNPFQASIGSYVHSGDETKRNEMFGMFDRISFFLACFISIAFCVLFNPFIEVLFGSEFSLGFMYVLMFAINQYIAYNHKFLYFYRAAFGKFEMDKWYAFGAAVLNIICSIIFAKYMGIAGIILGTIIGHIGFWIGRVKVVYSEYLSEPVYKYIFKQLINILVWCGELIGTYYICNMLPISVVGIILRVILSLIIPNLINFVLFAKTRDMRMIFDYLKKVKGTIKKNDNH